MFEKHSYFQPSDKGSIVVSTSFLTHLKNENEISVLNFDGYDSLKSISRHNYLSIVHLGKRYILGKSKKISKLEIRSITL